MAEKCVELLVELLELGGLLHAFTHGLGPADEIAQNGHTGTEPFLFCVLITTISGFERKWIKKTDISCMMNERRGSVHGPSSTPGS